MNNFLFGMAVASGMILVGAWMTSTPTATAAIDPNPSAKAPETRKVTSGVICGYQITSTLIKFNVATSTALGAYQMKPDVLAFMSHPCPDGADA